MPQLIEATGQHVFINPIGAHWEEQNIVHYLPEFYCCLLGRSGGIIIVQFVK